METLARMGYTTTVPIGVGTPILLQPQGIALDASQLIGAIPGPPGIAADASDDLFIASVQALVRRLCTTPRTAGLHPGPPPARIAASLARAPVRLPIRSLPSAVLEQARPSPRETWRPAAVTA